MAIKESPLARQRVWAGGNLRWAMVLMAFLGTTINYIDRANLGVAVPFIQKELHISPSLAGLALGAFFITYAIGQLPAGYFVDRIGARIVYTIAVAWWSVFTAATALARGFASLYVFRLLLGLGESGAYPSNAKVVAEWFPVRERAFATSIFDNGARFGTALSLPIVTAIIATLGWRASFVITGALGIGWAIAWFLFYRQPRQHPRLKKEELAYIEQGARVDDEKERAVGPRIRWIDLFRYRTVLGMMLGFFCLNFVIYFFITWFPSYLVEARHFSLLKLGVFGTIPAIVAIFGGWTGGLVADRLVRSGNGLD